MPLYALNVRKKVTNEVAESIFRRSDLTPLEPFPGTRERWRCRCDRCGEVVTPFYSSVANNKNNGCKFCARKQAQATKKKSDIKKALLLLERKELELKSEYKTVKTPSHLQCRTCGRAIYATIDSFRGERHCSCKKQRKRPEFPLSQSHPELSKQWNYSLNEDVTPDFVSKGSKFFAWWDCDNGHTYDSYVYSRVGGRGCPYCSGHRIVSGENDFASANPHLVAEWHFEKNGETFPDQIAPKSNTKFWWICNKDSSHEWSASPAKRSIGRGCPFCAVRKFKRGINDIATLREDWLVEWSKELNIGADPRDVPVFSKEKYWWNGSCGHSWHQSPKNRSRGFGCNVCAGKKVVPGVNDLASEYPDIALFLDAELNSFGPHEVTSMSGKKAFWFCNAGHTYESVIANKVKLASGCPVCSLKIFQAGENDLLTTNPEIAKLWDRERNRELTPQEVTASSRVKVWWLCEKGHPSYEATVRSRKQFGCPYCSGWAVLIGETDLETVNPALAKEWDLTLNNKRPHEVSSGSDYLAWWIDDKGHSWQQRVQVRNKGVGCPECSQGGFSSVRPGYLYLIHHEKFLSRKVGITNIDARTDRLALFRSEGWRVEALWQGNGNEVLTLETLFFRWLRKERALPPFLDYSDMPRTGGWSETFSSEYLDSNQASNWLNQTIESKSLELKQVTLTN